MSTADLLTFAKRKKLQDVSREEIKLMKLEHKFIARYERVKSPSTYMKTTKYRYGVCQIDIAFMNKNHKQFNGGCWGFIVCVEVSSLQVALEVLKDKGKREYIEGLQKIMQTSSINKITTLLSDQERSLDNDEIKRFLKDRYGIRLVLLKVRNKAYLAELFVSIVKKMLNVALAYAKKNKLGNRFNWVRFLKPIEQHLNSRKVPGTKFSRSSINEFNYMQMRNEQEGGEAYTNMNIASISSNVLKSPDGSWNKNLFKFVKNDKVLVDLRALKGVSRRSLFHKASVKGGYADIVFLVDDAMLKADNKGGYIPVYKVKQRGKAAEEQWFYESDLQKLSPKEEDSEYSSDEQ